MPVIVTMAKAYRVSLIIEPEMWMVAPSGMTKPATGREMPFLSVDSRETGIVAAEDEVPSAVK